MRTSTLSTHCTGCGRPLSACGGCGRELDPPRFCPGCGVRLVVRVTPGGFTARCREHGPVPDPQGGA